ncbi:MAG: hypothetical protein H7Z37_13290 [Pyrinomonadaceae bacterium]|nr:hypothetical protein [Pyrinomonadaceae bacterium]
MKKIIVTLMMFAVLVVLLPLAANAQTYTTRRVYRNGRYRTVRVYRRPSFYRRNRNLINIGVGTGAGALLGTAIGGGKGAAIGALAGAGGSALYTYKIRPKRRRY